MFTNKFAQVIFVLLTFLLAGQGCYAQRTNQLFNFGWKFHLGNVEGAEKTDFNDADWRTVDIPHDYQIETPFTKEASAAHAFKKDCEGWYRKSFNASPEWKGKKVIIDFEGLLAYGDIYVNGKKVGGIDYGYCGAEFDITKHLNFDSPNIIAVWSCTGKEKGSRWYTGGGLFRDVHLIVKNPISFSRHGIYINGTNGANGFKVDIQADIDGMSRKRIDGVRVEAKVFDPQGHQVGQTTTEVPRYIKLPYTTVVCPSVDITNPQLWDCDNPNLYTAEVSLYKNDTLTDQVTEEFGLRTIEYSKDFGFKLNGKKLFLKGVANHHDMGILGAAAYEDGIIRYFKQLKEFGYNHVRTSHNPYSPSFLKWADRMGILITDEIFDKWGTANWLSCKPFEQLWHKVIPEWIKRDRNHPSVILWSLGNELQMGDSYYGYQTNDWGITTYRILKTMQERYDNTRPSTVAMFPARANAVRNEPEMEGNFTPPELSEVTDIAAYNYQPHAYKGYLEHNPNLILYQSEATSNELLAPYHYMDREKMVGLAYWGAVEYWGESNGWPKKGWNYSYFNHNLLPYPQAWLIKSGFNPDDPIVKIAVEDGKEEEDWNDNHVGTTFQSSHWNRKPGTQQKVYVYSNGDEVELLNNGISLGRKANDGKLKAANRVMYENVEYGNGGTLEAIAYKDGKEYCRDKIQTTGKAVSLKLEAEESRWQAGKMSLKYIRIWAVDAKGNKVPTARGDIEVTVSGAATIYAIDNEDHYGEGPQYPKHEEASERKDSREEIIRSSLYKGTNMLVLRSAETAGDVTITATSPNLEPARCRLKTVAPCNE